ncbi:MAG: tetratricopeptide repeat protein [Elusimicrobia bacterium]|nr:tetratricopeptide repeat protein [Elusimicrobiota bacterium]
MILRRGLAAAALAASLAGALPSLRAAETAAEEATRLASAERFSEAVGKFEEAIRGEPENASLHLGLGLAHQSLRRYPEALRALERAAKLAPKSADPFYSLGLLYEAASAEPAIVEEPKTDAVRRGYREKAREAWKKVLRLAKDPQRLGVARGHLDRLAEADP